MRVEREVSSRSPRTLLVRFPMLFPRCEWRYDRREGSRAKKKGPLVESAGGWGDNAGRCLFLTWKWFKAFENMIMLTFCSHKSCFFWISESTSSPRVFKSVHNFACTTSISVLSLETNTFDFERKLISLRKPLDLLWCPLFHIYVIWLWNLNTYRSTELIIQLIVLSNI